MKFAFPKRRMPLSWRLLTLFGWFVTSGVLLGCLLLLAIFHEVNTKILEPDPLRFESPGVPEAFLAELRDRIVVEEKDGHRFLSLVGSARDLRSLVIEAFPKTEIRVTPLGERLRLQLSHPTPDHRYLNLQGMGRIRIEGGRLVILELEEARIGAIPIPAFLLPDLSEFLAERVRRFMTQRRKRATGIVLRDFYMKGDDFHLGFEIVS